MNNDASHAEAREGLPVDRAPEPPVTLERLEAEGDVVLDTGTGRIFRWDEAYWDDQARGPWEDLNEFFQDNARPVYHHDIIVASPAGSGYVAILEWRGAFVTSCEAWGFHLDREPWWFPTWQEALESLVGHYTCTWMPGGSEIRTEIPLEEILPFFEVDSPEGLEILYNGKPHFLFPKFGRRGAGEGDA